jgi:membrane-associated protein
VVFLSLVPIGIEYLRSRGKQRPGASGAAAEVPGEAPGAAGSADPAAANGTDPDLLSTTPRSGRHRANKR